MLVGKRRGRIRMPSPVKSQMGQHTGLGRPKTGPRLNGPQRLVGSRNKR